MLKLGENNIMTSFKCKILYHTTVPSLSRKYFISMVTVICILVRLCFGAAYVIHGVPEILFKLEVGILTELDASADSGISSVNGLYKETKYQFQINLIHNVSGLYNFNLCN